MTRHTFLPLMVLCWFAVLSISCGTAVPPPTEFAIEQPSQSQPLETTASSATNESADDSADNKVDAEQVLKNALARATAEDKSVLIHLGAPW